MKESKLNEYQMSLSQYSGILANVIDLDPTTANNFMRVSDLRKHVDILSGSQERVRDYDTLGDVAIQKWKLPKLSSTFKSKNSRLVKADNSWNIYIFDNQIMEQTLKENPNLTARDVEPEFIKNFSKEIKGNLNKTLILEKLANGPKLTVAASVCYLYLLIDIGTLTNDSYLISTGDYNIYNLLYSTTAILKSNITLNLINHFSAKFLNSITGGYDTGSIFSLHSNDPFIRKNPAECILPTVPIDRLIRGNLFLKMHGNELMKLHG